jgi:hypothetical protein
MKLALLLGTFLVSASAFAVTNFDCATTDAQYPAFKLTVDGLMVIGNYQDSGGNWHDINDPMQTSPYGRTGGSITFGTDGVPHFYFGFTGYDGHQLQFDLKAGQGTVDVNDWKQGLGSSQSTESVTCTLGQ